MCCIVFSNIFIIYVAFPLILLNKILNTSCFKYYGINSNNFKRKTAWLPLYNNGLDKILIRSIRHCVRGKRNVLMIFIEFVCIPWHAQDNVGASRPSTMQHSIVVANISMTVKVKIIFFCAETNIDRYTTINSEF